MLLDALEHRRLNSGGSPADARSQACSGAENSSLAPAARATAIASATAAIAVDRSSGTA
jgi:hypothetical protein